MKGKSYYKNQWSAVNNQTYMAAARYLVIEGLREKIVKRDTKRCTKKRQRAYGKENELPSTGVDGEKLGKKQKYPGETKSSDKAAAQSLLKRISSIEVDTNCPIYEDCQTVRKQIEKFLQTPGLSKTAFINALGSGLQLISLNRFRSLGGPFCGSNQKIYRLAYIFFEKKRILDGAPKSKSRQKYEDWFPLGIPANRRDFDRIQAMLR